MCAKAKSDCQYVAFDGSHPTKTGRTVRKLCTAWLPCMRTAHHTNRRSECIDNGIDNDGIAMHKKRIVHQMRESHMEINYKHAAAQCSAKKGVRKWGKKNNKKCVHKVVDGQAATAAAAAAPCPPCTHPAQEEHLMLASILLYALPKHRLHYTLDTQWQ